MMDNVVFKSAIIALAIGIVFGSLMALAGFNVKVEGGGYITGIEAAKHFISMHGEAGLLSHCVKMSLPFIFSIFIACLIFNRWHFKSAG